MTLIVWPSVHHSVQRVSCLNWTFGTVQHPGALDNKRLKSFPLLSGTKISSDLTGCNRAIGRGMMEFVEPAIVPGEIPQPDFKQSPFWKVTGWPVSMFVHHKFPLSTDLIHTLLLFQQCTTIHCYSTSLLIVFMKVGKWHNIIRLMKLRNQW